MVRLIPALTLALSLATAHAERDLDASVKFKLKKHEQRSKDKVVLTVKLPEEVWKAIRKARGKVRVNFYSGKSEDETRKVKKFRGKMKRRSQTWTFSQKKLCAKGHKHLRAKIKVKSEKEKFKSIKKTFTIDC
jgi:ribosomal protein L31E